MTNRKFAKIIDQAIYSIDEYIEHICLPTTSRKFVKAFVYGYLISLNNQLGEKEYSSIKQNLIEILETKYDISILL